VNEQKVYCEVELEGVLCAKIAYIPTAVNKHDFVEANKHIREYFKSLGYNKIDHVRIL